MLADGQLVGVSSLQQAKTSKGSQHLARDAVTVACSRSKTTSCRSQLPETGERAKRAVWSSTVHESCPVEAAAHYNSH
jgi:hypothetical protein